MKAYEIMAFLLIFNLSISMIFVLNIYDLSDPSKLDSNYNVSEYGAESGKEDLAFRFIAINIITITASIVAGALIGSWVLKIPADSGAAYGAFTGVFWGSAINTTSIFWSLGQRYEGIMIIVFMFVALMGVVFFVGLMQLVRGGWKGMK